MIGLYKPHSLVPVPVNQPHWRYRKDSWLSAPGARMKAGVGFLFLLTACFILYLGIGEAIQSPGNYLMYVSLAGLFLSGLWMLSLAFKKTQTKIGIQAEEPLLQPRPKKLPKHRKDYR